jgi:hypothetical protein
MKIRPVLALVAVAAVAFAAAAGLTRLLAHDASAEDAAAVPAARTSFAGLTHATGEPTLPSLQGLHPAPGTVAQATGPFDDRFSFRGLSFDGARVRGSATITSDVSDVLEFQAVAGFYDRTGRLLGTAQYVHHLDETSGHAHEEAGPPSETQRFAIAVPKQWRGVAVSAAVGVPVLVNE